MTEVDRTFGGTWPYEPHWHETADGRMHYVDEGPRGAEPVVLLHGNPTWGYLYRNFISQLTEAGYRAIAPDHLGFGRSAKPGDAELYRIARHAGRLESLLAELDLRDVTLVVQDWGGPIGLRWAVNNPERVSRLVILNTWFQRPTEKIKLPLPLRLFRAPVAGELLVKGLHAFVRGAVFRVGVVHRERLTADNKAAYLAPHPTWSSRTAILVFPREIPAGPEGLVAELLGEIEDGLGALADKPARIFWAMRDVAFGEDVLATMERDFPGAEVTRLENAGHYLQEDAHERIVPGLLEFLRST